MNTRGPLHTPSGPVQVSIGQATTGSWGRVGKGIIEASQGRRKVGDGGHSERTGPGSGVGLVSHHRPDSGIMSRVWAAPGDAHKGVTHTGTAVLNHCFKR